MSIAKKITMLRGKESRTAFASKLGISPNTLRNYETGLSLPNSDMLAKICSILHVDPGWLLLEGEDTKTLTSVTDYPANMMTEVSDERLNHMVDRKDDESVIELPPTSTIEDNKELSAEINSLLNEIKAMFISDFVRYKSDFDYIRINNSFAIPSDAKYKIFPLWPEAMGNVVLEYLRIRKKSLETDGLDSWRKPIIMIPPDEELNRREQEVFRRFNLKPTSKDVGAWFSNFFGKDAKLKRSRFCRFAFVVYAEEYLAQLQREFTDNTGQ